MHTMKALDDREKRATPLTASGPLTVPTDDLKFLMNGSVAPSDVCVYRRGESGHSLDSVHYVRQG
jgi:hypothetical protein